MAQPYCGVPVQHSTLWCSGAAHSQAAEGGTGAPTPVVQGKGGGERWVSAHTPQRANGVPHGPHSAAPGH